MLDIFFVRSVLKKLKKMKIFDSFLWKERKNALSCVWERKYIFGASLWPKNSKNRILPFPWFFSIWRIIICSLHMCCPSLICLCWSLLQRRKHIHLMMTNHVIGVKIIINCVRQRVEQIQILLEEVLHKHDDHISTGQHILCTSKIYGSFHNS